MLTVSGSDFASLVPSSVNPGSGVPMMTVSLTASGSSDVFDFATIKYQGTSTNDIAALRIYRESDGIAGFSGGDFLEGSATSASGSEYAVDLNSNLPVGIKRQYYVVLDLESNATLGNTVALQVQRLGFEFTTSGGLPTNSGSWVTGAGTIVNAAPAIVPQTATPSLALLADTGFSASDFITSNKMLTGTAEPAATVEIFNGSTSLGTTTAAGNGAWQFATGLADGTYAFTAAATGVGKSVSDASASITVTFDTTVPSINGSITPASAGTGWFNLFTGAPTVSFNASDLHLLSVTAPVTLGEGAGQSVTGTATDLAGNSASFTISGINVDLTAPTLNAQRDTAANIHGWNKTNVLASYSASDSLSGLSSLPNGSHTFTSEGANQSHTFTVYDIAGNSTSATVSGINIDKTAPVINGSISPASAATGWYNLATGAPTISFNASDLNLLSVSVPVTLGEGAGQSVTGTATDLAGNVTQFTISGINVDLTAPSLVAQRDTAANIHGWNNTNVLATYNASDALSGLSSSASGSHTFASEGANQSHTFTVYDAAGNVTSATVSGINIDKTAPVLNAPANLVTAPNHIGGAMVNYLFAPTDALSDIDVQTSLSASGSVFAVGATTVNLSATDKAGNTTSGSFTITVTNAGVDANGNLWLLGQGCGVNIFIDASNPSNVIVTGTGGVNGSYALGAGGRIIAVGTCGNDTITVTGKLNAELHGGAGNDHLIGGGGDDVLFGGDGDDHLTGGAGNDVLYGGRGSDRMVGGAGHDVLIAINLNDETFEALDGLRAAWLTTWGGHDPNEGADDIENPAADGNDMLTGSAGRDWFLVGRDDRITDVGKIQTGFSNSFWTKDGEDFIDVY